jgi:hypothetical protein
MPLDNDELARVLSHLVVKQRLPPYRDQSPALGGIHAALLNHAPGAAMPDVPAGTHYRGRPRAGRRIAAPGSEPATRHPVADRNNLSPS